MNVTIGMFETLTALYGIHKDYIRSTSRVWPLVRARHMIVGIMREQGEEIGRIGKVMNRTHATIINSVHEHQNMLETDKEYKRDYLKLLKSFQDATQAQ